MTDTTSGIGRRTALKAVAWSVPVIATATVVPAAAASVRTLSLQLVTTSLGSGGYDFNLRAGKFRNNGGSANSNVDRLNDTVVVPTFRVVDTLTGLPVAGATVLVDGGTLTDGEGNYVFAIVDLSVIANVTESATKKTATVITDATGQIRVKVATATWSLAACPVGFAGTLVPPSGSITVTASAAGYANAVVTYSAFAFPNTPIICP